MKKDLNADDLKQFTKIVREYEEKEYAKDKKENINRILEERDFFNDNFKHKEFLEARNHLLKALKFTQEDQKTIEILNGKDYPNKEYLSIFFIMTTFDYQCFIDKTISVNNAIRDKFQYILAADLKNDIELESQKSVLYVLIKKIYDFMVQASLKPDYEMIETLNHYLTIIGALIIATPYEKILIEHSFTIGINPNKTANKYCLIIPPDRMDNPLFKDLSDFYNKHVTKAILKNLSQINYTKIDKKIDLGDFYNKKKLDAEIDIILKKNLNNKLGNLRQKGGSVD